MSDATSPTIIATVRVNGADLAYDATGDGPPVVLLHAGIADRRMWDAQVPALSSRYRVVRYDARGYGRSEMPAGEFARWEDLTGLLRALGIERAPIVGASMGGATALDAALTDPATVSALVLSGSGLGGYQWSPAMDQ